MSSPGAFVDDASRWATCLVDWERERLRAAADDRDPIEVVAGYGRVSRNSIWALLYRPPKRVAAEVYLSLGTLYADECARQSDKYSAERSRTEAKTWLGRAMLRAADSLGGPGSRSLADGGAALAPVKNPTINQG